MEIFEFTVRFSCVAFSTEYKTNRNSVTGKIRWVDSEKIEKFQILNVNQSNNLII